MTHLDPCSSDYDCLQRVVTIDISMHEKHREAAEPNRSPVQRL